MAMAGRLNRPLPPEPRTNGRSPQPVPRQTHGSPATTPRSRPPAPAPAPTEAYEEVPSLQRPAPQCPARQCPAPPRPAPRPPTPPASDEEYEEPDPVPTSVNKNKPPTQQRQLLQRQLPKPPDSDEEYEAPAPEGPTEAYEEVPPPPQQNSAPRRRPPTPPGSDEEYEEPGADHQDHTHTPLPRQQQLQQRKLPAPPGGGDELEENEGALRPPLPPPLQQQDDYLAPGHDMSGPTEEYSEIPGGMDTNHNVPAPPPLQIPDDLYQDMPDAEPEVVTTSSLQKELLGKKLKAATRELPPKPTQQKTIHGVKLMEGLDEGAIKNAKHGLKKVTQVARDVVSEKSTKRDSSLPDPSNADVRTKAAKFGQKMTQNTALHKLSPQTVGQKDTPSPDRLTNGNTSSNTSSSSKSNASKAPEPPLPRLQETASKPQVPQTRPVIQPRKQLSVPDVPPSKKLSSYPWYFDSLSREDAIAKLKLMPQEGTYLIRSSAKDPSKPYTLSLFYKRKVWHLHLRLRSDGMFAVGSEKPEEECFASVPELVEYYTQDPIVLAEADKAGIRLIQHPPNDTLQGRNG